MITTLLWLIILGYVAGIVFAVLKWTGVLKWSVFLIMLPWPIVAILVAIFALLMTISIVD